MRIPLLRCVNLHVTNFRLWGVTFRFLPYSIPTKLLLLNIFWLIYYFIWIGIMYSKVKSESESCSVMSNSLRHHGLYSPWNSPGQNTGVSSCSLLWGIFPTQGSNPGLLHCRQSLYQLSHQGSWRILEWVAYPFSSRSSWPGNQTGISCIAGGFFTKWAIREALISKSVF